MNADKILFRASAIGKIMTGTSKGWNLDKSITAQNYCKQLYREQRYNRKQEITTKYMQKGISEEESAITLFSRVKKIYFKKNTEWLTNEFVSGTPDIYEGQSIRKAAHGYDTKCSWNLWTFPYESDSLDTDYYYQNMSYMALSGAEKWTTVFCLVNASPSLIDSEKKSAYFKMGCPDQDNKVYLEKCREIEKNMIFDLKQFQNDNPHYDLDSETWHYDIPMEERLIEFTVERNDSEIEKIYNRVKDCRRWMNENLFKPEPSLLHV